MLGFAPSILLNMKQMVQQNYAGTKISPAGFLKLLREHTPNVSISSIDGQSTQGGAIKVSTARGHIRDVKYKYLQPVTPGQVSSEDNCENDIGFQYKEGQLSTPLFSKIGINLEWGFVERYQEASSNPANIGNPNVPVIQEMVDQIMHSIRGIVGHMDSQLLNSVVWGTNVRTGNNAASLLNINKQGNVLDLSGGVTQMLADSRNNEFVGDLLLAGSGTFDNFQVARNHISANSAGMNLGSQGGYEWNFDVNAAGVWGADQVGAFSKGSVGLVDLDRYIAWKTGRMGTSEFAQIFLPVESVIEGAAPLMMPFNLQIKEFDCPHEAFDGYTTRVVDRGYTILISKAYGLFQPPADQFQATDRLVGNNGALRYQFSNDCDPCPAV